MGSNNKKILIIATNPELVDRIRRPLSDEGYSTAVADDGLDGLARARRDTPQLVIVNSVLPKLDGNEVCRQLRRELPPSRLRILMVIEES